MENLFKNYGIWILAAILFLIGMGMAGNLDEGFVMLSIFIAMGKIASIMIAYLTVPPTKND